MPDPITIQLGPNHSITFGAGATFGPGKKVYSGPAFFDALTDMEIEKWVIKSETIPRLKAVMKRVEISGIDFNRSRNITVINRLRTENVISAARKTELIG